VVPAPHSHGWERAPGKVFASLRALKMTPGFIGRRNRRAGVRRHHTAESVGRTPPWKIRPPAARVLGETHLRGKLGTAQKFVHRFQVVGFASTFATF
jgi:hypothetical protein